MKEIPLTQGLVALVDDDVFEWASAFKWHVQKRGSLHYAARQVLLASGKRGPRYLHREILKARPGDYVDHIDHNGLNNLWENLRLCTNQQNLRNQRLSVSNSTRYKGVFYRKDRPRPYMAHITVSGRQLYLGYFDTAVEAAVAYNTAAIQHFGEFAHLNQL